jgi:error-prone DNA polymerase
MEPSQRFVKTSPRRNLIASSIHGGWPVSRVVRELPQVPVATPQAGSYAELHCHSAFSLREGASLPEELVQIAKALGYQALALTDHDSLAGAMQFAQAARAEELQAIIGAEITLSDESHLTLLCETPRGYANLSRLLSRANLSSPRGDPRVRFEWLTEHAEGLIALSGCRKGEVARLTEAKDPHQALEAASRLLQVFGRNNLFIELQNNFVFEDETRNEGLSAIARELGLGVVATNNVHYALQAQHRLHDVLVAVRHRTNLEDARPHLRPNAEFYLKPPAEMQRLFADLPEATENTLRIADRCKSFNLTRDLTYEFPDYDSGDGRSADEFLHDLIEKLAREKYVKFPSIELDETTGKRIDKELYLIKASRRAGFFLRLWDILRYAHENELPVRGRGSSVGSVVCYLLGLSGIDPMKYDLAVERFLSEERPLTDVPDVDLDFGREARAEMFRHVFKEYGTDRATMVCTFIEYRYASAVRDVGKALGLAEADIDSIAKRMHSRFAGGLEHELKEMPEFAARLNFPIWQDFLEMVSSILGLPRHLSQHSGGIIVAANRMDEQVPIEQSAMPDRFICQWDKDSVADAGFIKLDFLGYPSLDQLNRGLRYVRERYGRVVVPTQDIKLDDQDVYAMIQSGDVLGVVQIQSRAQIQVLLRIKVTRIEDLIVQVALIRPGPIQGGAVHPYVARHLKQEEVSYDHPSLEPILKETLGVFVFQEQVILAATAIAGFSSLKADQLRRAMSRKRSREEMEKSRADFLAGAAAKGVDAAVADTVFTKIMAFASFGFPKSHAAAMAVTAFQVAWLKRNYPTEFYCALLNEQPMGFYSPEVIANDARRHDVTILGIDVNQSAAECLMESNPGHEHDAVRLGYRYLKHLGPAAHARLDEERANGPYCSLWDFWRRTRLERKAIESLISVGAFPWTGLHERELLWQLGTFYQPLGAQMPLDLKATGSIPALREMGKKERIVTDTRLIGIAIRGLSMDLIADQMHEGITPSQLLQEMKAGEKVTVAGLVAVRQSPETAKGFVFHTLEDYHGLMNVITKPSLIKQYRWEIESAPALIVHGHIEREERSINVIAERFEALQIFSDTERRVHNFG